MTDYIIPAVILIIFAFALIKDMPVYQYFTKGAKAAVNVCVNMFPYLVAILLMVQMMRVSGLTSYAAKFLSPVFGAVGIPKELTELVLLRPFSGAGSLAILSDVLNQYGADSYIGRCASVIVASSDTIFYVAVVYFSNSKVKKLRYGLPLAILINLISVILSCLLCRFL